MYLCIHMLYMGICVKIKKKKRNENFNIKIHFKKIIIIMS